MSEIYIRPEMLLAGMEQLREAREAEIADEEIVIAIYLAMEAVREVLQLRNESGMIH